jgi:hypothetical protein
MSATYNILIMGASYGSLLACKLLCCGHHVKLVCRAPEIELINAEGFRVHIPVRGRREPVEIDSRKLPGQYPRRDPATSIPAITILSDLRCRSRNIVHQAYGSCSRQ